MHTLDDPAEPTWVRRDFIILRVVYAEWGEESCMDKEGEIIVVVAELPMLAAYIRLLQKLGIVNPAVVVFDQEEVLTTPDDREG